MPPENAGSTSDENPVAESNSRVRLAPGLQLTQDQIELLDKAVPADREILVKQEFRSGYSGAIVMLVSVGAGRAPLVVKLAHPHDLQSEYEAYEEYVRQVSPQNIAHLQGEPIVSEDGLLGLLQYTFAGGESHLPTTSLQTYYESAGAAKTSEVLNRIFRVFGRHWWADNRAQSYVLDEYYDRLLPVHLQAEPAAAGAKPDHTIRAGKSSVLVVTEIEQGQTIHLTGFQVTKSRDDGRRLTLLAPPPPNQAAAPLRIRVESDQPSQHCPGDIVDSLTVTVTATRLSLLGDAAEAALPGFDQHAEKLTLPPKEGSNGASAVVLPNPLIRLPEQLYKVVETKMSIIHGDLNLQNILVDAPTGFAWLIDFAETRVGPTLLDLQRLEVQVFTKLMPGTGDIPLSSIADMMARLHADPPMPAPQEPTLQEPYALLVTIRRLARQYLIDDLDWNEYYYGLVTVLVGALKYDELDNQTRAMSFVAAAAVEDQIGKPLGSTHNAQAAVPPPVHPAQSTATTGAEPATEATTTSGQKRNMWVGVALALAAVVIIALVGWQFAGRSSSTPEEPAASGGQPTADSAAVAAVDPDSTTDQNTEQNTEQNAETAASTPDGQSEASGVTDPATEQPAAEPTESIAETETATEEAPQEATEEPAEEVVPVVAPQIGDTRTNDIDSAVNIFIPGGEFTMGSDDGRPDEGPAHAVEVDAFWIMRDEVTNGQYALCVDDGTCDPPASDNWDDPEFADYPVSHVTWKQADNYAQWAGGRLPTEAEWELAARGNDERPYPWGSDSASGSIVNFNFTVGSPTAVGSYPDGAGPFGNMDMAGNVEEWVADRYDAGYYSTSPLKNPQGPDESPLRTVRGGSYYSNGMDVRTFAREKALPDAHFDSVGFRVAMSAE